MLLLEQSLLSRVDVIYLSALSGLLNNILTTGGFQSVVLIHENRTEGIAMQLMKRRPPFIDCALFSAEDSSINQSLMDTSALRERSSSRHLLVILLLKDVSPLKKSLDFLNRLNLNFDTRSITVILEAFASDMELAIELMVERFVNVLHLFRSGGNFRLFVSDLYLKKHVREISVRGNLSRVDSREIFSVKRPPSLINMRKVVFIVASLKNVSGFMKLLRKRMRRPQRIVFLSRNSLSLMGVELPSNLRCKLLKLL